MTKEINDTKLNINNNFPELFPSNVQSIISENLKRAGIGGVTSIFRVLARFQEKLTPLQTIKTCIGTGAMIGVENFVHDITKSKLEKVNLSHYMTKDLEDKTRLFIPLLSGGVTGALLDSCNLPFKRLPYTRIIPLFTIRNTFQIGALQFKGADNENDKLTPFIASQSLYFTSRVFDLYFLHKNGSLQFKSPKSIIRYFALSAVFIQSQRVLKENIDK